MNQKEFESVIQIPANIRYEYFIKKAADSETVWGLYDDGWAMSRDDEGYLLIPFWPREEFAAYCAIDEWAAYKPRSIVLYEFMDKMIPRMAEDGLKPSIFFNRADSAVMEIEVLLCDLQRELEKY